jgi:hypothetical protein
MDYTFALSAGKVESVQRTGSYLLVEDTGAASSIKIVLKSRGQPLEQVNAAKRGHKFRLPSGAQFDTIELTSAVDAAVSLIVSDGLVDIDLISDANVFATLTGSVDGTAAKPLNVTAVTVADSPATAVNDNAGIAVGGAAAVQLVAANANRREVRIANTGTDPMAIGGAGLTWAKRTIVLQPGDATGLDVWVEGRFANLAVYAITDVGKAATAQVQEVIS